MAQRRQLGRREFLRSLLVGMASTGLWLSRVVDRAEAHACSCPEEGEGTKHRFLNGGCILVNHHELLFLPHEGTIARDISYAASLGAKVIRVFATDANLGNRWCGEVVGKRIADLAPMLRAGNTKLIVALVNNHQPVPGERPQAATHFGGHTQLAEPFYRELWKGAYARFVRGLIQTTITRGARDIIFAWEIGNELHTPYQPPLFLQFFEDVVSFIRSIDPETMIAPGTMGINHLDPGNQDSEIGLEFYRYLEGIGSFVTLHAYDFVIEDGEPAFIGDMPVHWDFDLIMDSGLQLPVIVEETGFSKVLRPYWESDQAAKRVQCELNATRYLLDRGAWGIGPWSACLEPKWGDNWRGISSYPGKSIFQDWQSRSERARIEMAYRGLPACP